MEKKVLFYIDEISNIEKSQKELDDTFKKVVENVKVENKRIKYKNSKKLLEQLEEAKLLKYQERMNRFKIKSIFEFEPPWIKKKRRKKKKIKTNTKEEDKQLLYFH